MRIVGGEFRGRTLIGFKGFDVRPTSDMARESLFNILSQSIYGSSFLDLFSGTGAIGLEALSRGAKTVVLNDMSRESVKIIKQNVEKLGVADRVNVVNRDAILFLETTGDKFDFVYIDPPYKTELGKRAVEKVERVLNDDGVAIFEDEKPCDFTVDGLIVSDRRKYGRVHLTFFRKG